MTRAKKIKKHINISIVVKTVIISMTLGVFIILLILLIIPRHSDLIKGVTYDLSYPGASHYSQVDRKIYEEDFRLMKKAGVNTIRLYAMAPDFILDLADKYHFRVIETVAFPGEWTDFKSAYQLKALKRDALKNIRRHKDRTCIYAWSIWNDAPWCYGESGKGELNICGQEDVSNFLREIYKAVKKEDPIRPVTAATVGISDETRRLGADFLDILGYNVYLGVRDWIGGDYDSRLAESTIDQLALLKAQYGKKVIITETGYSTYWDKSSQEEVISSQLKIALKSLDGIVIFQWADNWSKSGNIDVQDNNIEEFWGILTGRRKLKGGYYSLKRYFRNTILKDALFSLSDYFRGSYLTDKKRALALEWSESRIKADGSTALLINKLRNPYHFDVSDILKKLSITYFSHNAYDQFAVLLRENRDLYAESEYKRLIEYYIALSGWKKLKHLSDINDWKLYFSERSKNLDEILETIEEALSDTAKTKDYLKILYLKWEIHDEFLTGEENFILSDFEEACIAYVRETLDYYPLLEYSKLLKEKSEQRASDRLLRMFVGQAKDQVDNTRVLEIFASEAEASLNMGNYNQSKILYDGYVNSILKLKSAEDASFAILELAALYRNQLMYNESIALCERLLQEFPDGELADDAAFYVARAMKDKESYDEAFDSYRNVVLTFPKSELAKRAIKEALEICDLRDSENYRSKAVSFLKDIISLYPEGTFNDMAGYELALLLAKNGEVIPATREYQYIIDNFPNSEYAIKSKRELERISGHKR